MMYDEICNERSEPLAARGTPEHLEKVWADLQRLEVFNRKGTRVKLGRWGSWFQAARSWDGQRNGCLLVLLYMGITRGWWCDLSDLPLKGLGCIHRGGADDADGGSAPTTSEAGAASSSTAGSASSSGVTGVASAAAAPSGPAAGAAASSASGGAAHPSAPLERLSVKESNAEVQRLKLGAPHHLAFCAQVLGNSFSCGVAQIILACCNPIAVFMERMKTACSSPHGNESWHIGMAKGSLNDPFVEVWNLLSNVANLEALGFLPKIDWREYSKAELDGDNKLAEVLCDVMFSVIYQVYISMLNSTHRYPVAFLGLLDPDAEARQQHFKRMKVEFEQLLNLMREAHNFPFAKAFLSDLQWPSQVFVMELWFMLAEASFESLTDEIRKSLQGFSRSWLSTLVNENGFNALRHYGSNQSAGRMGRPTRWGNLAFGDLLEQQGRPAIKVTPVARTQAKGRVPPTAFVATKASDFSLGTSMLDMLCDGHWPHPAPAADKHVGASWMAWQLCECNVDKLNMCWYALLATPGTLLSDDAHRIMGVVVGSNQWIVLYQPVQLHTFQNKVKVLLPKAGSRVKTAVITSAMSHRAMRPRPLSPSALATLASGSCSGCAMAWEIEGGGASLEACAAKEGFKQLSKMYLDKLLALQRVAFEPSQRPRTVVDIVTFLVRHFIPKASDDDVKQALTHRGVRQLEKELSQNSVLAKDNNMEVLGYCVDEDDKVIIDAAVTRAKKSSPPGEHAPTGPKPTTWVRKAVDAKPEYSLAEARTYLPDVKTCVLNLDQIRFTRWSGTYPRLVPPHYCTKSYGPKTGLSSKAALFVVIRQLWAWHTEATGQECPWGLPGLAD